MAMFFLDNNMILHFSKGSSMNYFCQIILKYDSYGEEEFSRIFEFSMDWICSGNFERGHHKEQS